MDSFETGQLGAGRQSATWNGQDFNGNTMPPGVYKFEIQAVDAANQNVAATLLTRSLVTGVAFIDNTAHLVAGLQTVSIDDVLDVSEAQLQSTVVTANPKTSSYKQINGGL